MKIETAVGGIEKSGNLVEHVSKMEMNEIAFEVLSGGIYTDRETAIVRELSCNAVDAHTEAGNSDTPFKIHLPNEIEPHLIIRDYGTGLSPEKVPDLYMYYFKSTKANNNDFIGAMGLGSKTPYSYVESFHVTSYYNRKKYNFVAYKNDNNCSACTLMETHDTDEPNGLEIKISIPPSAHWEFQRKTATALRFFKTKPIIEGVDDFIWPAETEYFLQTDTFGICRTKQSSMVIMGGVAYPFSSKDFSGEFELTSGERKVVNQGIHFTVPMGAVRPNAGRERLTYNNPTKIYLKGVIGEAVAALEKLSHENIKNAKSIWEARLKFHETKKGVIGEIFEFQKTFTFQGKEINDCFEFGEMENKPKLVEIAGFDLEDHADCPRSSRRRRRSKYGYGDAPKKFRHFELFKAVKPDDIECILINDVERSGYKIIEKYLHDENIKDAIIFSGDVTDAFLEELDCKEYVVYVSTLPKPERVKRGSRGVSERTLIQRWDTDTHRFINEEVELAEGGVYVLLRHNKVNFKGDPHGNFHGNFENTSELSKRLSWMKNFGYDEPVYGIRPCDMKRIEKYKEYWGTFYEEMQETVEENILYAEDCSLFDTYQAISNCDYKIFENTNFPVTSPMATLVKHFREMKAAANLDADRLNAFRRLNESVGYMYTIERNSKLIEKLSTIFAGYPLFSALRWYSCEVKDLVDYINFIDSKEKEEQKEEVAA